MNAVKMNLPQQMRDAKRWLLWKSVPHTDPTKKPRKVPVYTNGKNRQGELDTPGDLANLTCFNDALKALETGKYTGLGFALGPDDSGGFWQGVDFDGLDDNPRLKGMVKDLPGYVETSPSGAGVHAIGYSRPFLSMGSNSTGIEAYSKGRYFTVTGDVIANNPITCLSDHIEKKLRPIHSPTKPTKTRTFSDDVDIDELRSALFSIPADDREVWQKMGHALKTLDESGRSLFMEWSATSPKHDPDVDAKTWESFKPTQTNYKAVFAEAYRQGWSPKKPYQPHRQVGDRASQGEHGGRTTTESRQITFTDIVDEIENPVQAEWLIDGLIEAKTTGALFGESTSGKSFVAVDLAACMATGTPWIGHSIENPGIALYFAGEGRHGMPRRFKAWQEDREVVISKNKLYLPKSRIEITPAGVRTITTAIDKLPAPPALIIIDTVARSLPSGSDENSAKDMMEFINAIDEIRDHYGCVVALIHHTGHSETARTRARGSSAFRAAMDWEILLDKRKSKMFWTKMKDAELPDPVGYELTSVDGSAVIEFGEQAPGKIPSKFTVSEEIGLKTLASACEIEGRQWATLEEWRSEFYRRHTGENTAAKRQAFSRAREGQKKKKAVIVDSDTYRDCSNSDSVTKRDKAQQCNGMKRDNSVTTPKVVTLSRIPALEKIDWQESHDA